MRATAAAASLVAIALGAAAPAGQPDVVAIDNLRAFAKLYGYVRYFHPSDEAAAINWDIFAIHGATEVRSARTPDELQQALERLFLPMAPTLRIFNARQTPPPLPSELTIADAAGLDVVAWQHFGVTLDGTQSVYSSVRLNRLMTPRSAQPFGAVSQTVNAVPLRGQEVRFSGRGKRLEAGGRVQLWLRVDLEGGGTGFFDNMMERSIVADQWTPMTIQGPVAATAARIVFGTIHQGPGSAVDDLRLEVRTGDTWTPVPIANGDFEAGNGAPSGWAGFTPGWTIRVEAGDAAAGTRSLRVTPGKAEMARAVFDRVPAVGDVVRRALGRDLIAQVPLALYSRNDHTLGTPDRARADALTAALATLGRTRPTGGDEAVRIADIVIAWNIFQHFYPYFDVVGVSWDDVLTEGLRKALGAQSEVEFRATLEWLVAELGDGHGSVSGPGPARVGLPIGVDWIEDQVVVTATAKPEVFRLGDVIESVDGVAAPELLDRTSLRFSGTTQWRRWRGLQQFGSGAAGSSASVFLRRGAERLGVTAAREAGQPPREPRPDPVAQIEPGIFYVNLDRAEIAALQSQVAELAAAKGIVFDLRGYPNGNHLVLTYLSDQPLQSAFWRVPQNVRPDQEGTTFSESRWNLPPSTPRFTGRIVFLTDGRAISYAESVMGIVEHYRLGDIVGQPTAGANGNVNSFSLPGGYRISFTGMRVVKHDGSAHHLVGIRPTVPMTRTVQGVRDGRDELLERAIGLIRGGR